jgi:hypothetical protein
MRLFNSVKMDKSCTMTKDEWMKAVKKQDKIDSRSDRRYSRFFSDQSIDELRDKEEQEQYHMDSGKSWEQVKQEVING